MRQCSGACYDNNPKIMVKVIIQLKMMIVIIVTVFGFAVGSFEWLGWYPIRMLLVSTENQVPHALCRNHNDISDYGEQMTYHHMMARFII